MYYTAFADAYWSVDEQVALDDVVVTRWTAGGTQSASLMGIPATNRTVKVTGMTFQRIQGGKILEPGACGTRSGCCNSSA